MKKSHSIKEDVMTFNERNNIIDEIVGKFKSLHDKYTSGTRQLSDDEWNNYVHDMDAICEGYKHSNLAEITWKLCQSFLDDTEIIQKKLKGIQ
jgi:hypothetical protein